MSHSDQPISVQFFQPPPELQPYLTALYLTEINVPDGEWVVDYLHPERAAFRFTEGNSPRGRIGPGELENRYPFTANGPTSESVWFSITKARCWGLGLQPAGWSKFAEAPASELANTIVDGNTHPAFVNFAPMTDTIFRGDQDAGAEAERIIAHLMSMIDRPVPHEAEILRCEEAIRDPNLSEVPQLREAMGMNERALERLCKRYFGFAPSILIRRQRFLRSLAQYMLDPSLKWIDALDFQYYDQAQFNRDFHRFMGMSPRKYGEVPHPILKPIMRPRMADLGAAEPIELPTILRYGDDDG